MTARLADLNLESSCRTQAFNPSIFLQPRQANSCRVVERFRLDVDSVRDAGSAFEANGTEPQGHAALRRAPDQLTRLHEWAVTTAAHRGRNKATIAVANKLARMVWAVWRTDDVFHARPRLTEAA